MLGAIIGDVIGSPYEVGSHKRKNFQLFEPSCRPTDDSIMTIAVGCACAETDCSDEESFKQQVIEKMKYLGLMYPNAGYGDRFYKWMALDETEPYGSYGNGSAMRVSPAAWLFGTMEDVRRVARLSAEVTHNHPEGIRGAEATAAVVFAARMGQSKTEIRRLMTEEFGYDLNRTCDEIRPGYYHQESCQKTVPEAFTAFLEGESFEDVIRTAVSLGGDCDTLTAIAGSVAEAYYGVPEELRERAFGRLTPDLQEILAAAEAAVMPVIRLQ